MRPKVQKNRETLVLERMWKHNYNFCTYLFIYLFICLFIYGTSRQSQEFGLASNGTIFLLMMFSKLQFLWIAFKHKVNFIHD